MSQFQVDSVDTTDVPNALHEHSKTTSYYVSVEDYILIHQDSQPLPQPSLSLPLSQPQSLLSPPPLNSIVQIIFFIRFLSIAWFSWILLKKIFAEVSRVFFLWLQSCSTIVDRIRGNNYQDPVLKIQDDVTIRDGNMEIFPVTNSRQEHVAPSNPPVIAGEKISTANLLYLPVLASILSYTLIASQETASVFGGYASFSDVKFLRTDFDIGALGQLFYGALRICRFVCKETKSSENVLEYSSIAWLYPENSILFFSASTVLTFMTHKFGYSWAGLFQKSGLNKPLKHSEDILDCAGGLFGVAVAPYIFYRFLVFFGFTLDIPSFLRENDENIWTVSYTIYVVNFVLIAAEIGAHYAKYHDSTVLYESDLNLWKLSSEFSDFQNILILYNQTVSCSTPILLFWL